MSLHDKFIYDDGLLINKSTGHIYSNMHDKGYIRVQISGKRYYAHRIIWEMFNGPIPEGIQIDHIDGDPYNNRIENLRLATQSQNSANRGKQTNRPNVSKELPKGVSYNKARRYEARITYKNQGHYLGSYDTPEEAYAAYMEAAEILHGKFVRP
jgi:hypothetical protein